MKCKFYEWFQTFCVIFFCVTTMYMGFQFLYDLTHDKVNLFYKAKAEKVEKTDWNTEPFAAGTEYCNEYVFNVDSVYFVHTYERKLTHKYACVVDMRILDAKKCRTYTRTVFLDQYDFEYFKEHAEQMIRDLARTERL